MTDELKTFTDGDDELYLVRILPESVENQQSWVHDRYLFPRDAPARPIIMLALRETENGHAVFCGIGPFGYVDAHECEVVQSIPLGSNLQKWLDMGNSWAAMVCGERP